MMYLHAATRNLAPSKRPVELLHCPSGGSQILIVSFHASDEKLQHFGIWSNVLSGTQLLIFSLQMEPLNICNPG